jgi:hypothetical protein
MLAALLVQSGAAVIYRPGYAGDVYAEDARNGARRVWPPDAVVRHPREANRRLLQHCEETCYLHADCCACGKQAKYGLSEAVLKPLHLVVRHYTTLPDEVSAYYGGGIHMSASHLSACTHNIPHPYVCMSAGQPAVQREGLPEPGVQCLNVHSLASCSSSAARLTEFGAWRSVCVFRRTMTPCPPS